jgi:hypothetical protein
MASTKNSIRLRWTGDYFGGTLSGFGLALLVSAIGQLVAQHAQGRCVAAPDERQ